MSHDDDQHDALSSDAGAARDPHDDLRTDTAQRPAVRADLPVGPAATTSEGTSPEAPQASDAADEPAPGRTAPVSARYPLYADDSGLAVLPLTTAPAVAAPPRRRGRRRVWVATAAVLVLVAGAGGVVLLGGLGLGDDVASDTTRPSSASRAQAQADDAADAQAQRRDERRAQRRAEARAERRAAEQEKRERRRERKERRTPRDVAQLASAVTPISAEPSRDVEGNAVRYGSFNLLDGVPSTAWRMPGDGAGRDIVLRLAEPTTLRKVGLINGYAKQVDGYDGYAANRRVTRVEWTFDDGSTITQDLDTTTSMQTISVPRVTTSSVTLRMLGVTSPGSRDFTAISDVALVGTPAAKRSGPSGSSD